MNVYAEYSLEGYTVHAGDEQVYSAGNHKFCSQTYVAPLSEYSLSLETLKAFAEQTAKEFADPA